MNNQFIYTRILENDSSRVIYRYEIINKKREQLKIKYALS